MQNVIENFDFAILDFIAEHMRCAFLDAVMPVITKLGDGGIFWICIAVILLFFKKYRRVGLMMGASFLLGVLVVNVTIKPLVGRIRPYDVNTGIELLIEKLSDFSFPSGHTLVCFEAATVLMMNEKNSAYRHLSSPYSSPFPGCIFMSTFLRMLSPASFWAF